MSDRQVLTDGTGRWFVRRSAERWDEKSRFDGNNYISCATGSQWEHETLYRTAGGRWILEHSSQWQGSRDEWTEISARDAARWLSRNGHHDAHPACAEQYAAL